MLVRWAIRIGMGLAGAAVGLLVSSAALSGLSITATALVEATAVFWIVHLVVQFLALRVLIRQPSVAMAGLLAMGSTVVALIIVTLVVPGLHVHGPTTYLWATLIIWVSTAAADVVGRRMIRDRRQDRREDRRGR